MPISTHSVLPKKLPQRIKEAVALLLEKPVCVEARWAVNTLQDDLWKLLRYTVCSPGSPL